MSWLNNSLNTIKGQLTNLAQEVLADTAGPGDDEYRGDEVNTKTALELLTETQLQKEQLDKACEDKDREVRGGGGGENGGGTPPLLLLLLLLSIAVVVAGLRYALLCVCVPAALQQAAVARSALVGLPARFPARPNNLQLATGNNSNMISAIKAKHFC